MRKKRCIFCGSLNTKKHEELVAHRKVEHFGQVLPIEDVERVIDMIDSITRMPCGCRFITTGKTDKRYCFGLGMDKWNILGKFPDAASSLEVLDKEEALRIICETGIRNFKVFNDAFLYSSGTDHF